MERSLVLVKPDGVERGLSGEIISRIEKLGLKLIGTRMLLIDRVLAERHYAPHKAKPFFESLVGYITSGPVLAATFEGEGAIDKIRKSMGATDPAKAERGTIRGDLSISIEKNTIHGSDSPVTAAQEIALFFKPADLVIYSRK